MPARHLRGRGDDRDYAGYCRAHLGAVTHQVPGRYGNPAWVHVHLEYGGRAGDCSGAGAFSAQAQVTAEECMRPGWLGPE